MIANALIFTFGFFAALLVALLLVPFIWRRASRVALKRYEAEIPSSLNEIRASFDHRLAAEAYRTRQREFAAWTQTARAQRERCEAGRLAEEAAESRERNRELFVRLDRKQGEIDDAHERIAEREREIDDLTAALQETRRELDDRLGELDDLEDRYRETSNRSDDQEDAIADLENRLLEFEANAEDGEDADDREYAMRKAASERATRNRDRRVSRLREEIDTLERQVKEERSQRDDLSSTIARLEALLAERRAQALPADGATPADGVDEPDRKANEAGDASLAGRLGLKGDPLAETNHLSGDDLRAHIEDFAARVIHDAERREAPDGPIHRLLAEAEARDEGKTGEAATRDERSIDLVERVRRLRRQNGPREEAAE